jgi:NTE family protein
MAVQRALVLGGGGVTGVAWETGLAAGLAEAGIDLAAADLVVGTSAGSVVGAQLRSGVPVEDLYQAQLQDPQGEIAARMGLGLTLRFIAYSLFPGTERRGRARLGRAALRTRTVPEAERIAVIKGRLPVHDWPEGRLLITTVDADTGEAVVLDRNGSADLVRAVAASCAVPLVWPPVTIDGHRYIDGGVRSITNADLATGCERVLVLAPATYAIRPSARISAQLASLGPGVRSLVVSPDAESRQAIGSNVLDPARRPASARAGRAQAAKVAKEVAALWSVGL